MIIVIVSMKYDKDIIFIHQLGTSAPYKLMPAKM